MPAWHATISVADIWKNFEDVGLEESVKQIVAKIKASPWRSITPYPDTFDELIADLGASTTLDEFNGWWGEIYDLADSDRIWIETF